MIVLDEGLILDGWLTSFLMHNSIVLCIHLIVYSIHSNVYLICKGLFEIPISQLVKPPKESRLLRVADDTFVNKLKEKMVKDPAAPGATPMAVLCKDVTTESFNAKYLNVYKYEVLGEYRI